MDVGGARLLSPAAGDNMMQVHFGTVRGSAYWGSVPPTLKLTHQYHKADDRGGASVAEVEVTGPESALWEVLTWLGRPVDVLGEFAEVVWSGMVNDVRVAVGSYTLSVSLDGLYNRIAVTYTESSPDGAQDTLTTAWAENAGSIARYGYKELVYSLGQDSTTTVAEAKRDTLLGKRARPALKPIVSNEDSKALVMCVGWAETLAWRTFQRLEGRIEHDGDAGVSYPVGWRISASTDIGMGDYGLHDRLARLGGLQTGHVIQVVSDGGVHAETAGLTTVAGVATSDGVDTYTNDTIFFDATDDVFDNDAGLGFIRSNEYFTVSGSGSNSKPHWCETTGTGTVKVSPGVTGAIVSEGVGPTITITQGHKVEVETAYSNVIPTHDTYSVYLRGERVAQSFTPSIDIEATYLAVQVGKSGAPSDYLACELYSDSSGAPGALLASGGLLAASVPTAPGWVWWTITTTTLSAGSTYWVVVRRTGSVSSTDHWVLQMTSAASGTCLVYDPVGATWVTEPSGHYMPYKVWAAEDTGLQMRRILADCGQFFASYDVPETGLVSNPYRDNGMNAWQEFEKLLNIGTSAGERLIATVTPQRTLVVAVEGNYDAGLAVHMMRDGTLWRNTTRVPLGYLPVGEWCVLDVPESLTSELGTGAMFISEAEFDAGRGLALTGTSGEEDDQL